MLFISVFLLITENIYAQSPYAISPKWYFGRQAGMDFTGGAPVVMAGGQVNGNGQEESSTMCDTTGNVLFYSDSYRLYDGTNTFKQNVNGGTSSGNSSVCFPDPANPTKQFYYVTANQDPGGGGDFGATLGIYYYLIQRTGPGTISVLSGPTMLATNGQVTEQLCAGVDTNGGYWVATHQGGGANGNQIWAWNFTALGVGSKQISSVAGTENNINYNGSMKINKCQNKLAAIYKTGKIEVYNWDQAAGKVTSAITCPITVGFGYGCEFSPNGNILYFTDLTGNHMYQWDLIGNTAAVVANSTSSNNFAEMGTLQIGPDDKIYVANGGNFGTPAYVGVINNPDVVGAGCNYNHTGFLLNAGPGFYPNTFIGIANEAWINPILKIDTTGACKQLTFAYHISTYFGKSVSTQVGSEEWDFGDGSGFQTGLGATPTHTYASGGSYTITMRVKDAICGNKLRVTKTITVNNCTLPPPGCTSNITASIAPVSNVALDLTNPVTVTFDGSGTAFDGTNPAPHKYYWSVGTPDTLAANIISSTVTSSLTFQYNGNGGNHPQGSYDVYLIIRQGYCMDTVSVHINVTYTPPPPPGCTNGITASINPVSNVTLDLTNPVTVNFNGSASAFDGTSSAPQKYFWAMGAPDTTAGIFSTTSTASLTFQYNGNGGNHPQGSYDIYLIIKQGYCIDTKVVHINAVYTPPVTTCINNIQANIQAVKEIMIDDANAVTVNFSGTSSLFDPLVSAPHKYFWSLGNPDTTSNVFSTNPETSLSFAYKGKGGNYPQGSYDIYLIIKQGYCIDTVKTHLDVTHFYIPNLVTPNGDDKNDKFEISNTSGRFDVEVYNRWGERIFKEKGYTNGWDLGNVSDGVYYFNIIDAESAQNYKGWVQVMH